MKSLRLVAALSLVLASTCARSAPAPDAPGFFQVRQTAGRWDFIDPQGKAFFSVGVDDASYRQDEIRGTSISPYANACAAKYGSIDNWRAAMAPRLFGWGFNTLGAWSDPEIAKVAVGGKHLAYTIVLGVSENYLHAKAPGEQAWLNGIFPDVFDPDFTTLTRTEASNWCGSLRNDPNLLGYFSDNEMRWGADWRGRDELLVLFLNFPPQAPGRRAALDFLRQRYPAITGFNATWGTSFASWDEAEHAARFVTPPGLDRQATYKQNEEVQRNASTAQGRAFISDCDAFLTILADRYFGIVAGAIRGADPNHLYLGCRFAYVPAAPVLAAAQKYADVISFNCYDLDPGESLARYAVLRKPLLIGEFSFRAKDSGLPNAQGAGAVLATQADRAAAFERFVRAALRAPELVGYHWFENADEPREGRFDGENSNIGLVDIHDNPYAVLVNKMTEINGAAPGLHQSAAAPPGPLRSP